MEMAGSGGSPDGGTAISRKTASRALVE